MKQASRISERRADLAVRKRRAGRLLLGILFACIFCFVGGICEKTAMARGASITISTKNNTVLKGDTVYVVITVKSSEPIKGFEGYFTYNSRILQFVTGGNITHGNDDTFRINDTNRTTSAAKITYSVKFIARKAGSVSISLRKPYHAYAYDDTSSEMSVSYNTLNILVKKKPEAGKEPEASEAPKPSPSKKPEEQDGTRQPGQSAAPEVSAVPTPGKNDVPGSARLRKLSIEGVEFVPEFEPGIRKYSALVETDAKELKIDYQAKDSQANVVIKGNKNLAEGKNTVKVIVTSTAGEKTVYRLSLTIQHINNNKANRITVTEKKGKVYLKGNSKIEVLPVKEDEVVPEGFEKTQTTIDGKEITSYALKDGGESSFVLIYGKGNKEELYLYDKEESTLMPYQKVKSWYRSLNGGSISTITDEERMIQSLKYVIGIMAAFCGLLLVITVAASIRAHRH